MTWRKAYNTENAEMFQGTELDTFERGFEAGYRAGYDAGYEAAQEDDYWNRVQLENLISTD